jgi:raffinose/stachyose/melibiose transport system substrate-binding protein
VNRKQLSGRSWTRRKGRMALLAAAVALVAAGLGALASVTHGATGKQAATLQMWHWQQQATGYPDVFQAAIDRYKAKNGGNVQMSSIDYPSYFAKFKTAAAGGDVPDLMEMSWTGDYRDLIKAGALLPLDSALKTGFPKFYKPVMDSLTFNGHVYGIPIDLNTLTIAYNKAIFGKLHLKTPKTFAQLLALAQPIRKGGYQPLSVNEKDAWPGGDLWFAQVAYTDPSGKAIRKAELGGVKWTDPRFLRAATNVQSIKSSGLLADGSNSTDFVGNVAAFGRGQVAMAYPVGNFNTGLIDKAVNKRFSYDLFPFPPLKAGGKALATGGPAIILSVPAKAKNPTEAINLIRLMTDATGQKALVKRNFIPSAPANISSNPSAIYKRMVSFQATAQTRAIFVPKVYTALLNGVQGMLAGSKSPKQVVSGMQAAMK